MATTEVVSDANPPREPPATGGPRRPRRLVTAAQIVLVRLRFLLALLAILLLVGYWDVVRNYWDKVTRPAGNSATPVSLDTEYWCPMCPGVLSEWPGKCPVCNMALVRRKKGEAVPLPDGVVARMQLSPYRIQLAGVLTSAIEYRPLAWTTRVVGFVEKDSEPAARRRRVFVPGEIFEKDLARVTAGAAAEATCDAYPGRSFSGVVADLGRQVARDTRAVKVRLAIDDPKDELLPAMLVCASVRSPLARSHEFHQRWADAWRDRTASELLARALCSPAGIVAGGMESSLQLAGERVLLGRDLVPAIPEGAVVDTGARRVVYRESMPGTFDGVEVVLGQRCGEYFPVLRGVEFGDRVVASGALLIDAETRLNPGIAASYFGAERRALGPAADQTATPAPTGQGGTDRQLIERQKVCPVTGEPLGSMGPTVRVIIAGKTVFICCKACEPALKKNPEKYLAKLRSR